METKAKLLLAEDDENLGLLLKEYLIAKGFDTDLFGDGELAYAGFKKNEYNLCILDVMMPKKDGISLARDIRLINQETPIIFLSAKNLKEDVLEGFRTGADDYITKPFSMEELIFRIEAILRRTAQETNKAGTEQSVFKLGRFTFDPRKQVLTDDEKDETVKLTTKESELLRLLCNNANKVLERNFALKTIWIDDNYFNARSMDVYITKLRKHLKEEPSVEIINVHGKGYKLIL
ncbi:response regulator transcription factor RprY [Mangrovibacterium diazotrophicum]|uniref:DNA-binding response OmpR family regulator n=1 Tax=Mangrovibacterium diazotrophicum TaxID=1261403 RepID=A0A419W7T1_9BACT|nr:response regulator transcription factor [Mangrovibacterium diazotrophicum]RKD91519.1 DNA-binding response OmpR family regulator [Mangrovibacterium diazotrophicum]